MSISPAPSSARRLNGLSGLRSALPVVAGAALLAVAAHVKVPFWPVPMTLQTLVVLLLGAVLGPAGGVSAVVAWVAAGVVGLPVFAGGLGAATLLGPTGGYMVGYLGAALITGLAARRGLLGSVPTALLAFLFADAVLFAAGVAWLAVLFGWSRAIAGGLTPFLLGEALKIGLATAGVTALASRLPRRS